MAPLQETCSGGGPVIAIPAELAHLWKGTDPPDGVEVPEGWVWGNGDILCDYDRACDDVQGMVELGYGGVGWLEVGEGRALILDMELVTAFAPKDFGGVILRNYEEEELTGDDADAYLSHIQDGDWRDFGQTLEVGEGSLFLFDSAYPGASEVDEIEADDGVAVGVLGSGTYAISLAHHEGVDFIRLERM